MFADRRLESWWRPETVYHALRNYRTIEDAAQLSLNAVEARVDIDRAIELLPSRLRTVADHRFRREFSQDEIARKLRLSQQHVSTLCDRATEKIQEILCCGVV